MTDRLIVLADHAYASRDKTALAHIGAQISKLSVSEGVGDFYLALALSQADRARADKVLESVAECSFPLYRARALLALGSHRQSDGDIIAALEFYQDAERLAGSDSLIRLYAGENRAIVESARGNHKSALAGFLGVQRYATGANLFNNLNSQAEELRLLGRYAEAAHLSRLCLSSPFADRYPEWQETAQEIHTPIRSKVYIPTLKPDRLGATVTARTVALMSHLRFPNTASREISNLRCEAQGVVIDVLPDDAEGIRVLIEHLRALKGLSRAEVEELTRIALEKKASRNDND